MYNHNVICSHVSICRCEDSLSLWRTERDLHLLITAVCLCRVTDPWVLLLTSVMIQWPLTPGDISSSVKINSCRTDKHWLAWTITRSQFIISQMLHESTSAASTCSIRENTHWSTAADSDRVTHWSTNQTNSFCCCLVNWSLESTDWLIISAATNHYFQNGLICWLFIWLIRWKWWIMKFNIFLN